MEKRKQRHAHQLFVVFGLFFTIWACSDQSSEPTATNQLVTTQVVINDSTAEPFAIHYCEQKGKQLETFQHAFTSSGAGNGVLESCNSPGSVSQNFSNGTLTFDYSNFCFLLGAEENQYTGQVAYSLDGLDAVFEITDLDIKNAKTDMTINGDMSLTIDETKGSVSFMMNFDIVNNKNQKQLKLENVTASFVSFNWMSSLIEQLINFDGDLSFADSMKYSGRIYYSDFGYIDMEYEQGKTILIGQDNIKLEISADEQISFTKVGSSEPTVILTACP